MSRRRRRSEASESDADDYPAKRRKWEGKWTVPPALTRQTDLCGTLYEFLRRYRDAENKCLSECLIRAPSRRSLPSYYEVVSQPIDLMKIQQKLKTDEYKTVDSFLDDVRLLFDNAKLFYDASSEEHISTVELEKAFAGKLADCGVGVAKRKGQSPLSPPSLTLKIPKSHLISLPGSKTRKTSSSSDSSRRSSLSQLLSTSKSGQSTSKTGSAGRQPVRLKVTRSRAWVEEWANSNNPVKLFMSAVYDHHDSSGAYVAEIFHELPSRQDYPDYYRVITEPLDLNMIKKNTEDGRYVNLKAIQDDMILLIKNAHHFNEPGSFVYRAASSLRKFIISKCAELERRFQTVKKTMPVRSDEGEESDDTRRKVPKLKLQVTAEGKIKGQRSRQSSSSAFESQSDSSDEGESSSEIDEVGTSGKLLLRIKKEKLSSNQQDLDPVTKLLKIKRLPVLKKRLMAIYRSLVNKMDTSGRVLCELFMKRPSASMYPQYYLVIKNPIDLKEILHKIRSESYMDLNEMMSDVELMVENACTFNEEDSQVYKDAVILKDVARDAYQRLQHGWAESDTPTFATPTTGQRGRPRKVSLSSTQVSALSSTSLSTAKCPSDVASLYNTVKSSTGPQGQHLWLTFKHLPPSTSTDYYSTVKRPIDTQMIDGKFTGGGYLTPSELMADVALLCDNAYGYHSKESRPAKDAILLLRVAVTKYTEFKEGDKKLKAVTDVPQAVQGLLNEIVTRALDKKDPSGHCCADSLKHLVVTKETQVDADVSTEVGGATIKRRFNLDKIREWTKEGRYSRLQQLQEDLLVVLRSGRAEYESEVCRDSFKLEQTYLKVRDEVCMGGALLWSPALEHTISDVEAQMTSLAKNSYKSPSPPPSVASTTSSTSDSSSSSDSDSSDANEEGQLEGEGVVVPGVEERTYLAEVDHDGVSYALGDVVHLLPSSRGNDKVKVEERKPQVVLIEGLWTDRDDNKWLDGCWYYHPEETFHLASRKFYKKEVFKSDFRSVAQFSQVVGKACVLFIRDYLKFLPEGYPEENVYVCESRYTHKAKVFKKIKHWAIQGAPPNLVPREAPPTMDKVPSVFAEDIGSSKPTVVTTPIKAEGEELMETDELDVSICDNLVNIQVAVGNPESKCTYYEQYCIDSDYFRLGDFVYLRSDQEQPFIARIDRMWTDANGDPWIRGPWFVRPGEVVHNATRMFYSHELFMSNIQDTNPMRSICGKCAVLHVTDYVKKRPTEYAERDVYLVESRYNESEKDIRKMKTLKRFELTTSCFVDEIYHFKEELHLWKVPSPKLYSKETLPDEPLLPIKPHPLLAAAAATTTTTATGDQIATPTTAGGTSSSVQSGGTSGTVLNIPPHLLQKLLASASQISTTRPVVIPLQQNTLTALAASTATPTASTAKASPAPGGSGPLTATPTLSRATTSVTPSQSRALSAVRAVQSSDGTYTCAWDGCGRVFGNVSEFSSHLLAGAADSGHITKDADGHSFCCWAGCPRNPAHGGRPFDTTAKLMRHLREVHLMKISNSVLGISSGRGGNFSSAPPTVVPAATVTTASITVQATPTPPTTQQSSTSSLPQATSTTTSLPGPAVSTAIDKPRPLAEMAPIMKAPSVNRRQAIHSDIYKKYIKGLESDSQYMSTLQNSRTVRQTHRLAPTRIRPTDWINAEELRDKKDSASLIEVLWSLRDQLLQDSLNIYGNMEGSR